MKYTTHEIKYLEKYIRRLEKDKKHWPWLRWLMLFASILLMGSTFYLFNSLTHLLDTLSSVLSMPKKEVNSEMVKLFVEGQVTRLRLEMFMLFKITFYELFSAALFVYSLKNWNRHIKQSIMIKVMQDLITKERDEN